MSNTPVNCRYFYGDYHRGNNREECRLLAASPTNERSWQRKHCNSCPVPSVTQETNCRDLLLEAEIQKRFLSERVVITFSVCAKHLIDLDDPHDCPECAREWESIRSEL